MDATSQFQTVVYDPNSGKIEVILPNQYIKSHASLDRMVPPQLGIRFKFFYERSGIPLDKKDFIVHPQSGDRPPRLISKDGSDPTLSIIRAAGRWVLAHYDNILFEFEGGMGDYMDQADALLALRVEYPEKHFSVSLRPERYAALKYLVGFDAFKFRPPKSKGATRIPSLSFSTIGRMGANYPPGGKVGVYSAIAGLASPAKRAAVEIPAPLLEDMNALIDNAIGRIPAHIIALHTMSGNTNTKSIPPAAALDLISPLLENEDVYFLHLGGAGEALVDHPRVIPMLGLLTWQEVFGVLSWCNGCICIDSAIMHIAQHLKVPTVSLWGPTAPQVILDDPPGIACVVSTMPCAGCNRYECDRTGCMTRFNRRDLNKKMLRLLEVPHEKILSSDGNTNGA